MAGRVFQDREEAGRELGAAVAMRLGRGVGRPLVLALPRGGVPVGYEVARAIGGDLDVFLARKLGAPMHPELGMGALTEGGLRVLDDGIVRLVGATPEQLARVEERERAELLRRVRRYRGSRALPEVRDRVVVVVDDGVATGGTARATLRDLRKRGPRRLILAVPVGAAEAIASLGLDADEVVCLSKPAWFHAIGEWYVDFRQLADADVLTWLDRAREESEQRGPSGAWAQGGAAEAPPAREIGGAREEVAAPTHEGKNGFGPAVPGPPSARSMRFRVGSVALDADVTVPAEALGVVVFAHGSGSSRRSPRNRAVANALVSARFATVLFDLLTPAEEVADAVDGHLRFDIPFLTDRLVGVLDAVGHHPELGVLPCGLFGASTGAAAALRAAAKRPDHVRAVVSRGGRPDLAGDALPRVRAPVLLIVGGRDDVVIELNRAAMRAIRAPVSLAIVPHATHLFEERGALEQVSRLAAEWLHRHLGKVTAPA